MARNSWPNGFHDFLVCFLRDRTYEVGFLSRDLGGVVTGKNMIKIYSIKKFSLKYYALKIQNDINIAFVS